MRARTGEDRLAEIQEIFDARFNRRLRDDLTPEVSAAIETRPLGPHDDRCSRVVRAFANSPVAGKLVVVSLGPDGPWSIGKILIGAKGNLVVLPETYASYVDAMREIFIRRRDTFLAATTTDPTHDTEA